MELTPGAVVAGRYRVDRKIGAGGMGEVWAGEHVAVGVRVALKTLLPAAACDPQIVARFRREANVLGRLRSDRVARVVDFVEDRRVGLVLVMDLVEGEPLGAVLETRSFGVEEAVDLGVDIVAAVCDLHRAKIVHRDLKPDNIILEPRGGGARRRAVIVDFGVSRVQHSAASVDDSLTNITMADVAVGTIPFMAPEQILSSRDATGAADLYAVGAILFRAVAGVHVFGGVEDADYLTQKLTNPAPPLPVRRVDRLALGLAAVVSRALERRPEERYASAEAMLRDLSDLQELARMTAMDLDAPTEEAPLHLVLSSPIAADEEKTSRISLAPDTLQQDLVVESTLDSPGTALPAAPPSSATTLRDAGPPPGAEGYPRPPSDAPTRISVPPGPSRRRSPRHSGRGPRRSRRSRCLSRLSPWPRCHRPRRSCWPSRPRAPSSSRFRCGWRCSACSPPCWRARRWASRRTPSSGPTPPRTARHRPPRVERTGILRPLAPLRPCGLSSGAPDPETARAQGRKGQKENPLNAVRRTGAGELGCFMNIGDGVGTSGGVMLGSPDMLERTRLTLNDILFRLSVAAAAALALSSSGCAALVDGTHDVTVDFPVEPVNGTFFGWSEVTLQENIDSVTSAVLYGVTLQVEKPAGIPDLTFLESLTGSAATSTGRTLVVEQTGFPKGQAIVPLKLVYFGDLHPLFEDQYTIRIDWTGQTNQSYTGWPADGSGIWVNGDITVDLQE